MLNVSATLQYFFLESSIVAHRPQGMEWPKLKAVTRAAMGKQLKISIENEFNAPMYLL